MTYVFFPAGTIAGMLISGLFCIIMPIGALVFFKLKNKEISILPAVIGAAMFFAFALILEQLLHAVMLPIVSGSVIAYTLYGALAAGVFEETSRFIGYKFILKKHTDPRTSIMYGIGHGGCEAIMLVGISMLSYAVIAVMSNSVGFDAIIKLLSAGDKGAAEVLQNQLGKLAESEMSNYLISAWERIPAMLLHISLSVIMFEAVRIKGRMWLFPVAVLLHAILDVPAALYQCGAISIVWAEILIFVCSLLAALLAWQSYKRLNRQLNNT